MCRIVILLVVSLLLASCRTGLRKKDLHEQYAKKLIAAGLDQTALGRRWFQAAESALAQPQPISLPYKESGYFSESKPRAAGLRFNVKRGQKIQFELSKNPSGSFVIYADLWEINQGKPEWLTTADTSRSSFDFEARRDGYLLLRLQPELLRSGDYSISISIAPSLSFPVASRSARVGSFWGDARDNGGRRHEGIDIFAPRGTPAIAAANGTVVSVTENKLGGKVVFLRPKNKNFSLYYAHLDSQLVSDGDRLRAGDTIGLVGNTGNAKTTPPHLHFGIYTSSGAVDPFPFVDPAIKKPAEVMVKPEILEKGLRLQQPLILRSGGGEKALLYKAGTPLWPFSRTATDYWVELPDGMISSVKHTQVEELNSPLKSTKTRANTPVFETVDLQSPRLHVLPASSRIEILANFNDFYYIRSGEIFGWIPSSAI